MAQRIIFIGFLLLSLKGYTQRDSIKAPKKERLDFAQGFFELGGEITPSYTSYHLTDQGVNSSQEAATFNSTFYWGAFHFWGHTDFYVSFPLKQYALSSKENSNSLYTHATVTGMRWYPWAVQDRKLRPFLGLSWSAFSYQQSNADEKGPVLEKNFSPVGGIGVLYKNKTLAARLGMQYFFDHTWKYPLSTSSYKNITTPALSVNLGVMYTTDFSKKNKDPEKNVKWNQFPELSPLSYETPYKGSFFIGVGPSGSFTLNESDYTKNIMPYLNQKKASQAYADIAIGYQFDKANMFIAASYRAPRFKQEAYGTIQEITKKSLAIEATKFITDYSGFAPFVGVNFTVNQFDYEEKVNNQEYHTMKRNVEPGLTFGWDIVPGKTDEYLVLRTNLRWYPFSSFQVKGQKFSFSQLEYNLIQAVFYPGRMIKSKK